MALNHVGYPSSTSLYTVNRACASSLQAIATIADSIAVGRIDAGIGAGMESLTRHYASKGAPTQLWPELKKSRVKDTRDCFIPIQITGETVARRYDVSRVDQDVFGTASHNRASKAQKGGLFDNEIVPVSVTNPPGEGDGSPTPQPSSETVEVSKDDCIRHKPSLARIRPGWREHGTATVGNTGPKSDGAAAALLMRRSTATSLGLSSSIVGKFAGTMVVGVAPNEMGVGPAYAIPALLSSLEISNDDVNVWEISETLASQALYCVRKLGLEKAMEEGRVNPRGGAIALGHPLGATGGRMLSTILSEMGVGGLGEVGVVSMCIGTGMGIASLVVKE